MSDQLPCLPKTRVAVVIPCYRVERHIAAVIRGIPDFVSLIVAVDDASPDGSAGVIEKLGDPRVVLVRHEKNQGVGGALVTGYRECLRRGAHVIVKMDGDGQMDPAQLPALIGPLVRGEADYAKGNRWHHADSLGKMPALRRLGNLGLSFLAKLSSGQWKAFDPCNGYTAIRSCALRRLDLDRVARDYYFEISMLVELSIAGAVIRDVPMPAIYGDEKSSLRIRRILWTFPRRLVGSLLRRAWQQHFIRDFGPITLFLTSGTALMLWALGFGAYVWGHSFFSGVPATPGTVMMSAMPFLMGFQLLLQSLVMDVASQATVPLAAEEPLSEELEVREAGVRLVA